MFKIITLCPIFLFMACVHSNVHQIEPALPQTEPADRTFTAPWFQGTVEQAYALAEQEQKLIFLYWGAVWCPPCAELKSEVFSKPQFSEVVAPLVPVYLDGDTEQAQALGEKLQISGYPTILILDAKGQELVRLSESINFEEFTALVTSIINSPAGSNNLSAAIKRVKSHQATPSDWKLLAYSSWDQLPKTSDMRPKEQLDLFRQLADQCPASLEQQKAILSSNFLSAAATMAQEASQEGRTTDKDLANSYRKSARTFWPFIVKNQATIKASRSHLIYSGYAITSWLWPNAEEAQSKLTKPLQTLIADKSVSVDTRLWAHYPFLEFAKHKSKPSSSSSESKASPAPSSNIKNMIKEAVLKADKQAITPYQRKAVISGAAYLLRQVNEFELARTMLLKELNATDTPWYYYSSLASLEKAAGNPQKALTWSKKARESVQGRASKLQWLVEDLLLVAKIKTTSQEHDLLALSDQYYLTAFSLQDGFVGRNKYRAQQVSKALEPWSDRDSFKKIFAKYRPGCQKLPTTAQAQCRDHFAKLIH